MSLPNLGVRVDAIGTEAATAKIKKFGASVGALPRDFQAASRESRKLSVNMQKMSFAAFGASLAITSTVTSLSRLEKSALNVNRATVALERGNDLVTRKQAQLNKIIRQGETFTGQLALANSELTTALNDVLVKEEDLKIKTGEVSDTYINFAASLGASVLFSVTAFFSAIKGLEFAHVKAKIAAINHAIANKVVRTSAIQASPAMNGMTTATAGTTIAMIKATFAAHGLAAGMKAITRSFAPLLIALVAITAAIAIYEANFLGIKTATEEFFGIQKESTLAVEEATVAQEEFNQEIGQQKGLKGIRELIRTKDLLIIKNEQLVTSIEQVTAAQGSLNAAVTGTTITDPATGKQIVIEGRAAPATSISQRRGLPGASGPFPPSGEQQLNRLRQINEFRKDTLRFSEEILELTQGMTDEEAIQLGNAAISQIFEKDAIGFAEKQLRILIVRRRLEEQVTDEKRKQATIAKQTARFPGLDVSGLRDPSGFRGRVLQITGVDVGPKSFNSLNDAIRFANQQRTLGGFQGAGGQGGAAIGAVGGNATDFFQRSVQTPLHLLQAAAERTAFRRSRQGIALAVFSGQTLSNSQGNLLGETSGRAQQLRNSISTIRDAVLLGLMDNSEVAAALRGGAGFFQVAGIARGLLNVVFEKTRASKGAITASGNILAETQEFRNLFFEKRFVTGGGGVSPKQFTTRGLGSGIDTAAELKRAILIIQNEAQRQAFVSELERRIDREQRFQLFQLQNPNISNPEGTALFLDTGPLADALERIFAGEDHKQFIKLLAEFKAA